MQAHLFEHDDVWVLHALHDHDLPLQVLHWVALWLLACLPRLLLLLLLLVGLNVYFADRLKTVQASKQVTR